jgi:hypothetical protein
MNSKELLIWIRGFLEATGESPLTPNQLDLLKVKVNESFSLRESYNYNIPNYGLLTQPYIGYQQQGQGVSGSLSSQAGGVLTSAGGVLTSNAAWSSIGPLSSTTDGVIK